MTGVMITGGTGTFGRAAIALLLSTESVSRIVVFSRDEQKQEAMRQQLPKDDRLRFFLGDVRDSDRLAMAMKNVNIVVHAAAMKIVPSCEQDPFECVKTNITGAANLISAAIRSGDVRKIVAISTDKAASPANLYGGSKFVAEKLFVAANHFSIGGVPAFSVVRYGNVSGSRGSVIPLWRRLAKAKTPLPITDKRMTRFWITAADAVRFVFQAVQVQQGGEIFIPKMPSYRILDLAQAVWGDDDIHYKVVGVRTGEKLHEDLITIHEAENATQNDHAYVICPPWLTSISPLPEGFSLSSGNNPDVLSIEDLKERLAHVR